MRIRINVCRWSFAALSGDVCVAASLAESPTAQIDLHLPLVHLRIRMAPAAPRTHRSMQRFSTAPFDVVEFLLANGALVDERTTAAPISRLRSCTERSPI
jgi:hypothetical protein